jgi:HEPN domain-containing protein
LNAPFDGDRVKDFWVLEAEEALQVAEHLMEKGDYSYALFFGHLAVEKALKALYAAKRHDHAPPIHNLMRLAKTAGLSLHEAQQEVLLAITAFSIEARYPDINRSFRKRCTREYSEGQMATIKEMYQWIRSQLE